MKLFATLEPGDTSDKMVVNVPAEMVLLLDGDFDGATLTIKIDPGDGDGDRAWRADNQDMEFTESDTRLIMFPGPCDFYYELSNSGAGEVKVFFEPVPRRF